MTCMISLFDRGGLTVYLASELQFIVIAWREGSRFAIWEGLPW